MFLLTKDFWRMAWSERSSVIVMLTQTFECVKVMSAQYWPNKLGHTEKYGEFSVTLVQEDTFADYKVDICYINTSIRHCANSKISF